MIICVVFILSTCDTSHFHFPLKQFKDTATIHHHNGTKIERMPKALNNNRCSVRNLNKMLTLMLLLLCLHQ